MPTPDLPLGTTNHFLKQWIAEDLANGANDATVVTRFPPEPNGWIHIGHAKAVHVDFGLAQEFGGKCHLRMDDTNPSKETDEFVEQIKKDIAWLGYQWSDFFYAAEMFDTMWNIAEELIRRGQAYVCQLTQEEWKEYRGVPTRPGKPSPYRDRKPEENLELFRRMKAGEFADGTICLRAKIDMASPNIHFRDPVLYRINRTIPHYHTGNKWCCYPMYDFAHPIEDALEGVTHSMCTLEFEVHRPLYDWVVDRLDEMGLLVVRNGKKIRPKQREFARLNLTYTVMSKRLLRQLVEEHHVSGWDDPRMPTIAGLRRRGCPAAAVRNLCERVGVSKYESVTDLALLEFCIREDLNNTAFRRMAVLDPVRLVIDNYPEDFVDQLDLPNHPANPEMGFHQVPFGKELWIERDDFRESPEPGFHRLLPGKEVRLRGACIFKCTHIEHGANGEPIVHGTYDPNSRGGNAADGRKVKGTIHWVYAPEALSAEFRLYDRLFTQPDPLAEEHGGFLNCLNQDSLKVSRGYVEPSLREAKPGERFQFERLAYFCADEKDSTTDHLVFNRTVTLRESK
ncbi:MAG: glutamine--tRNA ligase/YqeY domain fusion protein [Kiritimatiellia bacterium]|nr:glutamine--tRNA ligase/YqeY domain fusion protein [Kiritimatiellia bacterium]